MKYLKTLLIALGLWTVGALITFIVFTLIALFYVAISWWF